jgi:hypothetical protein
MSEWPIWDHWKYFASLNHDDGRYTVSANDGIPDDELPFVDAADYEPSWARKWWWTADEAAALSFGKSPNAVPYDDYMASMDGSSEFVTAFCAVREHIMQAQSTNDLADPFPAKVYVDWALKQGMPLPPQLAEEVTQFFDQVMRVGKTFELPSDTDASVGKVTSEADLGTEPDGFDQDMRVDPTVISPSAAGVSVGVIASESDIGSESDDLDVPVSKREMTLLSVLYALAWWHYGLGKPTTTRTGIATAIAKVLHQLREKDVQLPGAYRTISTRLDEALKEFGVPPPKD